MPGLSVSHTGRPMTSTCHCTREKLTRHRSPGCGGFPIRRRLAKDVPGHRDLDGPALVAIARSIDRAAHVDADLQARDVPRVDRRTAVAVRLDQHQIPRRAERVHLELVVRVGVAIGIDEDLEVVVVEDDGVALGQRSPDVRLLHLGTDVEVLVVPQHLRARAEARRRRRVAFDVDERVGPGSRRPARFVEFAVDIQSGWRAISNVSSRRERHGLQIGPRAQSGLRSADSEASGRKKYASVSGERVHIRSAALRAQHEERVVERIAGRSAAREDRDAQHPLHRSACARIHDVRVGHAPGLERLFGAAGHRKRPVFQPDSERGFPRIDRILDLDVPSIAAGRRTEPVDRAASGADQGGGDLPLSEQPDDAIDGVAFGDASEIQLDAGVIEAIVRSIGFAIT